MSPRRRPPKPPLPPQVTSMDPAHPVMVMLENMDRKNTVALEEILGLRKDVAGLKKNGEDLRQGLLDLRVDMSRGFARVDGELRSLRDEGASQGGRHDPRRA